MEPDQEILTELLRLKEMVRQVLAIPDTFIGDVKTDDYQTGIALVQLEEQRRERLK